jgi:hypothetical protein
MMFTVAKLGKKGLLLIRAETHLYMTLVGLVLHSWFDDFSGSIYANWPYTEYLGDTCRCAFVSNADKTNTQILNRFQTNEGAQLYDCARHGNLVRLTSIGCCTRAPGPGCTYAKIKRWESRTLELG